MRRFHHNLKNDFRCEGEINSNTGWEEESFSNKYLTYIESATEERQRRSTRVRE